MTQILNTRHYSIKLNGLYYKGRNIHGSDIWTSCADLAKQFHDTTSASAEQCRLGGEIVLVPIWAMQW